MTESSLQSTVKYENEILSFNFCICRYNISTNDYDPWNTNASKSADPRRRGDGSKVSMAEKYGFDNDAAARQRGYIFKNNPQIKVFGDADFTLRLAINTAQYGRTFQDRYACLLYTSPSPRDQLSSRMPSSA